MRFKCKNFISILGLLVLLLPTQIVYAADINDKIKIDGNFSDWSNKPSLIKSNTGKGNTLSDAKWYGDNSNLYLYLKRNIPDSIGNGKGNSGVRQDWDFETYMDTEFGTRKMSVNYHPASQMVNVYLYDDKGKCLWSDKGKWGDNKNIGASIELYIPFRQLVGNIASGYEINIRPIGENQPEMKISTASTAPIIINGLLISTVLFVIGYKSKNRITK